MRRVVLLGWVLTLFVGTGEASGQTTGSITGTATEASSARPLVGVTISVVGAQLSTLTGAEGRFFLDNVPLGTHAVRVAMLGYGEQTQSVEVTAGEAVNLSLELSPQALLLEGIVVVGYGTQERRDVTGSVSSVDVREMKRIPTPNLVTAMKGKVAGVDIVHSGHAPGEGMRVRVRGTRSLSATNEPLYVVDGVPLAGGIQDFNPADIESIEILKDASATAVYGSRGANGVVLITTTQGSVGDTRITYSFRSGVSNVINRVDLLNGPEFAEYKRQAYWAAGLYPCPSRDECAEGDAVIFADPVEQAGLASGRSTDWTDIVLRDGSEQLHQFGIRGGDERTRFNVSGEVFDEVGVVRGQDYDRKSIRAGIEHDMSRLSLGATLFLSRSVRNVSRGGGLVGEAHGLNPLAAPYDDEGNPIFKPDLDPLTHNPLFDTENWIDERERTRAFGSIFAAYQVADWLSVRSRFGPDVTFARTGVFIGEMTDSKQGVPGSAQASQAQDRNYSYTLSNTVTADREFGDAHRVQATLLYEIQEERFEQQLSGNVLQLPYEHQKFYNLGSASAYGTPGSQLIETALQSYMARVNYHFLDRYVVTLTGRYDGSSRLAPGNKYSFFPSVAVAWQLGQEPFMAALMGGTGAGGPGAGFLSELKLRASWGRVGNSAVSPYQTQGGLARTHYVFGNDFAFGHRPDQLPNPDLKWERTTQLDIGLDFGLLDNRITGSVDFYRANTDDLLMERQLPSTSGYQSILENVGQTRNTGIEISLSTINLQTASGFRWTTDINLARNKNEIISLYGGTEDDIGNRWFIGQPIHDCNDPLNINGCRNAVFFDFDYDGIWQEDEADEAATYGARPGMIRVKDQNDDGTINDDDRVLLGNTYPDWTGGMTNRFEFKNIDLSIFATARMGQEVFNGTGSIGVGRYNMSDVPYWTPETSNNRYPQPDKTDEGIPYSGTLWYEDGSNIRIRNITLGYTLPASLTERWGVRVARIYGSAHDPFLFTDFQGYDPEGATTTTIPSARKFLLGASIEF
ncbi:MAG: SusC/RagA family TonB-linked outer membrane protein [Longimicrobiales bacterium]